MYGSEALDLLVGEHGAEEVGVEAALLAAAEGARAQRVADRAGRQLTARDDATETV